jgi:hypothetical protein
MKMSKSTQSQLADAKIADGQWKDLYRIGLVACSAAPVAIACAIIAFFIWPYTPGTVTLVDIFASLHTDRMAGLMSLDFSVIILLPILMVQMLALYVALKKVNELYALIALVAGLMGIGLWLAARPLVEMAYLSDQYAAATTESTKSYYLAAGEALHAVFNGTTWMLSQFLIGISYTISCLLMLRSMIFRKATAYVGLALAIFGYGFWIPVIGPILSLLGTVAGVSWYILMARDFRRLGWQIQQSQRRSATMGEIV